MVTRTAGRLLDPSPATTLGGISMPVAVLPAWRILVRNRMLRRYPKSAARCHHGWARAVRHAVLLERINGRWQRIGGGGWASADETDNDGRAVNHAQAASIASSLVNASSQRSSLGDARCSGSHGRTSSRVRPSASWNSIRTLVSNGS